MTLFTLTVRSYVIKLMFNANNDRIQKIFPVRLTLVRLIRRF